MCCPRPTALFALALLAAPPAGSAARAQVLYSVTDLTSLPGAGQSYGQALNNAGQVAGVVAISGTFHGFRWSAATGMVDLNGGGPGQGNSINSSGQIAGSSQFIGTLNYQSPHAIRTTATGGVDPSTDLGVPPGGSQSAAIAINDLGQVTGYAATSGVQFPRVFRTTATGGVTTASLLGTPANTFTSYGYGINASGQVTGDITYTTGQGGTFRTTATGDLTDPNAFLGTLPGGTSSRGTAINASGQVTGYSNAADGHDHAFRTTATGNLSDPAADLGTLPGYAGSAGMAINALGVVVGQLGDLNDPRGAMVYDGTGMHDLNDLIPAGSGWVLTQAWGINDFGWITGEGAINGQTHAFLLTPVPEPSSLALVGAALVGGWAVRRWRRRSAVG